MYLSLSNHTRPFVQGLAFLLISGLAHAGGVPGQGTWETTLQPRDLDGNGSTDAYYDTVLDITWLADADFMATSAWDENQANGGWPEEEFADYLAGFGHLGVTTWRLPAINNPNQGATGGELAHVYAVTLGNILAPTAGAGLVNTGPFTNLQADCYLYNTGVNIGGLGGGITADAFSMSQTSCANFPGRAWAVADGDVQPLVAAAPAYEIVDLGTLGGTYSVARDINNNGQIVGNANNGSNVERAFLYTNGAMQDLGTLMPNNSGRSAAFGINNLGAVTGAATADAPVYQVGFLYDGNQMTALGPLPANGSDDYINAGAAINDTGDIALSYFDSSSYDTRFGVRAANGTLTIDTSRLGSGRDINAAGHAIGSQNNFGYPPEQKLLFKNGLFYVIGTTSEGGSYTTEIAITNYAIDDNDQVVGSYYSRSCGSNFCDPADSYGRITAVGTLPINANSHTAVPGSRAIHMINAGGDMVGKYAYRWIVRPAGGPSYFLDGLIDTTGWNWSTASLNAMNDNGDIVGSATTSGGQTHAVLLRKLAALDTVSIDVDPFSTANEILPSSNNLISVAVLSTNTSDGDAVDFDATQVDPTSLQFGIGEAQNVALPWAVDVGGDGDTDVLFAFHTQDTGIFCGDTSVSLTGTTYAGAPFQGSDAITTVDCEDTGCHP